MRYLLLFTLLLPILSNAQTTVTIVGSPEMEDAAVSSFNPTTNRHDHPNIIAKSSSNSGQNAILRTYFKFDLDTLPATAVIMSATLDLYYRETSVNQTHEGLNECVIQKVVDPWQENTINWVNQPAYDTAGQVFLQQTPSATSNYFDIDITNLVIADWAEYPNNKGFLMKLLVEQITRRQTYSSMDNPDQSKRPRLTITYQVPSSIESFEMGPDAEIYPNPAIAGKNISIATNFTSGFEYKILSTDGKLIMVGNSLESQFSLSTAGLASGIYIVNLSSEQSNTSLTRTIKIQ
jgi:hypothetical protein